MKVYSLLILLCFFQSLICESKIDQETLKAAFTTSLPFIKSFHPAPFRLYGSKFRSTSLTYTELNENNVQFKYDEFGLLHLKFVNLKALITGETNTPFFSYSGNTKVSLRKYCSFRAELSNVSWDETYAVDYTQKADGKKDVHFKSMGDTQVTYNVFRVTMNRGPKEEQNNIKAQIRGLNFSPFKAHLKKMSGLILETLKNRLK